MMPVIKSSAFMVGVAQWQSTALWMQGLWVRPPSPTPAHEEETPGKGSSTFNIHNVLTGPVTEYP